MKVLGLISIAYILTNSAQGIAVPIEADIVSTRNCSSLGSRISNCEHKGFEYSVDTSLPSYVPLVSVFARSQKGNCSTIYPINVVVSVDGNEVKNYGIFSEDEVVIPQPRGLVANKISVSIDSPFSRAASYFSSCDLKLVVKEINQINYAALADISSKRIPEIDSEIEILDTAVESFDLNIDLFDILNDAILLMTEAQTDSTLVASLRSVAVVLSSNINTVITAVATDETMRNRLGDVLSFNTLLTDVANATNCDENPEACLPVISDNEIQVFRNLREQTIEFVSDLGDKKVRTLEEKQNLLNERALLTSASEM